MADLIQRIPQGTDPPHPLGRAGIVHLEANREWPIRAFLLGDHVGRTRKPGPWWARHVFDQRGSSCTMQTAAGLLLTSPIRKQTAIRRGAVENLGTEAQRHAAYLEAQRYDPWPGGEPSYEGSSSDAPYRWLRERGAIREWRWCFGIHDVNETLARRSALGVGVIWHESMFGTDKRGRLLVDRSTPVAGGHEILVIDYDEGEDEYEALNSWGRRWGRLGRCTIKGPDFRYLLLEAQGDASTVVLGSASTVAL